MWIIRLFYIIVFYCLLPLSVKAQVFSPPYKAVKTDIVNSDLGQAIIESVNPDSPQKSFYIGIQNYGILDPSWLLSQMKFYDDDFKLIDAVNTNDGESYLENFFFLSDFNRDGRNEIITPVVGQHRL